MTFKAKIPKPTKLRNIIPTNFHENYLKLGLWPELSYDK